MRDRIDGKTKARVVALVDEGLGAKSLAKALGVSPRTARTWICTYRRRGGLWLADVRKNQSYPLELKIAAARAVVLEGQSVETVLGRFGISTRSVLTRWVQAYRDDGEDGLRPKKRGRPAAESRPETDAEKIARLEMENAALKKLAALVAQERRSPRR